MNTMNKNNCNQKKKQHDSNGKRRNRARYIIPLYLVMMLIMCFTVGGTLAFMQKSTGTVTNTFKSGKITYTLNLEPNAKSVNHNDNEVEMPSDLEFKYATDLSVTFNADKTPLLEGYTFDGWYYGAECKDEDLHTASPGTSITVNYGDAHDSNNHANKVDITLYAKWTPITYTVEYNQNGDDKAGITGSTASSTHTYDAEKTLTDNGYTRTGYTFISWNTEADGTGKSYADKESVMNLTEKNGATVILYAQWTANEYTVSFDVNTTDDVDKPDDQKAIYGESYGTLPTITRDKYKFTGWTLTKDGDDYVTKDTIVNIVGNHTLYAKWVGSHEYTITYYANSSNAYFTGNKQQVTDTKVQDDSYTIKTPTELGVSRSGYVWTQWNTKPDGTGTSYLGGATYTNNSDLTLYAIWATETAVTFGEQVFVNMGEPSKTPGADAYNFTIKCKTQGGADGIVTPIYNLIPGEAYRLTFSVTFNNFKFYRDDDGDKSNKNSTNGSYIFGTNIIDQYENYDTKLSIISQDGKTTTSKYENMQWSTINSGHYELYLDFVPTSSTMYWFWETTDIQDHQEMSYEFNNFNIQNFGPAGSRVEFEDLTVTFDTAPTQKNANGAFSNNNSGSLYVWPNASNGTVRHKNYFHTESFGTNYLYYRVFGYSGHERMTIPISGLTVGQWYELSFTQNLSGATVYNTGTSGNNSQLYGTAVSSASTTSNGYGKNGCVDMMDGYQDLRRVTVGNSYNASIKFQATQSTMYWHWTLGDLQDYIWSDVSLSNVTLRTIDPITLEEPVEEEISEIEFVYDGIDDANMDIWYPVDEQTPVAGDSYEIAFEPSEGYTMAETITVVIDGITYEIFTNGEIDEETVAPVYDPENNRLTIPSELLTEETTYVSIIASAVEVVNSNSADQTNDESQDIDESIGETVGETVYETIIETKEESEETDESEDSEETDSDEEVVG